MWLKSVRSRYVVAGLAALALIGAAVGIFILRPAPLTAAAMMAYFPEREATIVFLDVAAIRNSGLLERIAGSTVGEEAEYKTFVAQTGFDYKRDLDRVMLNSAGGVHYFLLQGRFDWNKLRSYAQQQGGKCAGEECSLPASAPERVISFRSLRRGVLAMATARDESGSRAVDHRRVPPPPFAIPAEPVWVHVPAQAIQPGAQTLPSGTRLFAKALEPAERVIFALGPAQANFQLSMDVACRTPEQAAVLRAQLESLTRLLQGFIRREGKKPNAQDLSGVLTTGSFTRQERHVVGKWTIERAFFESLGGS